MKRLKLLTTLRASVYADKLAAENTEKRLPEEVDFRVSSLTKEPFIC